MTKTDCEVCGFENPRCTVTGVIIRDGKLLLLKRSNPPFQGEYDFPGGFAQAGETTEVALKRELKEELGVDCRTEFIGEFPGTYLWKERIYPVVSFMYLCEIDGDIRLNEENSEYKWIPIPEIESVAFDSNKDLLAFLKAAVALPLEEYKALRAQLSADPVNEAQVYRGSIRGFRATATLDGKLIGAGWIQYRDTPTRRQATVEDMIVDEAHRRLGVGETILETLIEWAKENDCDTIDLTTHPRRIAANALYKKKGFIPHETNHYLMKLK